MEWVAHPGEEARVLHVTGFHAKQWKSLIQQDWNSDQWQNLLSVYADQGSLFTDLSIPSMLGDYELHEKTLCFRPKYPLSPGVRYRSVFHPEHLSGSDHEEASWVTRIFQVPRINEDPSTQVTHVYPSADVLPENLLKFYLHFSAPMSRGNTYKHIQLLNQNGQPVELPFLELDEELWNASMTRLTLFIDPGRIKRGVRPLEEIGPSLEEGKTYTLAVDSDWNDSQGNPLQAAFRKSFQVGPPDRSPPDPNRWRISTPQFTSRDPLIVEFQEPMDHALANRMLHIVRDDRRVVDGKVKLKENETVWHFIPSEPWTAGNYSLIIETTIEDLAGNNIGKPFEVDRFETPERRLSQSTVTLPLHFK